MQSGCRLEGGYKLRSLQGVGFSVDTKAVAEATAGVLSIQVRLNSSPQVVQCVGYGNNGRLPYYCTK